MIRNRVGRIPSLTLRACIPTQAPGGSRGTPGMHVIPRAMRIRKKPNDPVSPDFRPGLFGGCWRESTGRCLPLEAGEILADRAVVGLLP